METYKYNVVLQVEVKAFSDEDAKDLILDVFGPGNDCGVEVTKLSVEER